MTTALAKTLLVAPLRVEARALQRGAAGLRVLRSGAGPQRSERAVSQLRADPARRLVVAGLCGALEPDLAPGEVVLASRLLDCPVPLYAGAALEVALSREGLRVHRAAMLSVPRIVQGAERTRLCARGAAAVDMESRWLAPAAEGRPLSVVRVVLDGPRHELVRPATARHLLRGLRALGAVARAVAVWSAERDAAEDAEARSAGGG